VVDIFTSPAFWSSTISAMSPIAFAALGALLASRAGVLFVGVEGTLLATTFTSLAIASVTGSLVAGVLGGLVVGALLGLLFGAFSMTLGMGDVVAGLVLQILSLGACGFLLTQLFPQSLALGNARLDAVWPATGVPLLDVFVNQPPLVYLSIAAAVALGLFLRSRWGLQVRACGDSLRVSYTLGVPVRAIRFWALAACGALTGLGGAFLGLGVVGSFSTNVTGGRGFIALACVIVAAWRPVWAVIAALAFSIAYTYGFQAGDDLAALQLLPYVLTIVVIALFRSSRGPAEEGKGLVVSGR
jgi:ABC-type uncharacterized transport system permease subunit